MRPLKNIFITIQINARCIYGCPSLLFIICFARALLVGVNLPFTMVSNFLMLYFSVLASGELQREGMRFQWAAPSVTLMLNFVQKLFALC